MKVSGNHDKKPFFFVLKQLIAGYMYHPKKKEKQTYFSLLQQTYCCNVQYNSKKTQFEKRL